MLPLATTTVTVKRPPVADDYAEPYSGTRTLDDIVTGLPAVIDAGTGRQVAAGGEQTVTELRFYTDEADVKNTDYLLDETSGVLYRITWCITFTGDHVEGGIELVEGLV